MNPKILTQLLSVSPPPAPASRGGDAVEQAPAESFGQVMSRVGADTAPRAEAAVARREATAKKADARERGEPKPNGQDVAGHEPPKTAAKPAAEAPADDGSAGAATDESAEPAADATTAKAAADLLDALLLPAAAAQPISETTAATLTVAAANSAASEADPNLLAQTSVRPTTTTASAAPAIPAQAIAADETAPVPAKPATASTAAPANPAQAVAAGETMTDTDAAALAAEARMLPDAPAASGERRLPARAGSGAAAAQAVPGAMPPRTPVADALAAPATPAEAGELARALAREHRFDALLDSRALSAPRAEPATQAVAFASLLATTTTSPSATAIVATPPGQPGFAQDFGNRVLLLASGQIKSAELSLTPAELGPVRVSIELRGQDASIAFVAHAAATRAALEEALPRLREMFTQQGLNLLDASVGAQVGQQGHRAYGRPQARRNGGADEREAAAAVGTLAGAMPGSGSRPVRLIDVIA